MSVTLDLEVIGFTGFYQGLWDQTQNECDQIDNLKYGIYEELENLHMLEDWGFQEDYRERVAELFADEYADMVESAIGINVKLIKSFVKSPREYNFRTDEIYAQIQIEDYNEFVKRLQYFLKSNQYHDKLAKIIRENHTSYDGFISLMSNDIDEWYALIEIPNNKIYVSCLVGYIVSIVNEDRFNLLNSSIYEFVCSNTDLHCVHPITDIAKEEFELYEKYNFYSEYAKEYPLIHPDEREWEKYKERFIEHAEECEKELRRKEEDAKYPFLPGFEPDII